MNIASLFMLYPDACFAMVSAGFVLAYVLNGIHDVMEWLWLSAYERSTAARCEQFHAQNITGWCSGSGCPYRQQCYFHSGYQRPTIREYFARVLARFKKS